MSEENKKRAEKVLQGMLYSQHTYEFLVEILSEYPSLIDRVKFHKENGILNINVGMDYGISKPGVSKTDNHITVVINK